MENYAMLEQVFEPNFSVTQPLDEDDPQAGTETLAFHLQAIGNLIVRNGRIVACDPLVSLVGAREFTHDFPKGAFPVELAIARTGDEEYIAFARIRFSNRPAVRWENAVPQGHDPAELGDDELFGYGVDSGTGAFMDTSGQAQLHAFMGEDAFYFDAFEAAFDQNYQDTRTWLLWEGTETNAAMFTSGLGDGFYPSFVGYDPSGAICRLVTDFGLVDWEPAV